MKRIELSEGLKAHLLEIQLYKSEFVERAIRFALQNKKFMAEMLKEDIIIGIDQADRGEFVDGDMEKIMTEIRTERKSHSGISEWKNTSLPLKHAQT